MANTEKHFKRRFSSTMTQQEKKRREPLARNSNVRSKKEILMSIYYHDSDCVEFSRCAAFLRLREGADLDLGVTRSFL